MRFSLAMLFLATTFFAQAASAQVMKVEGSLPRDLGTGQFSITVTVSKVPAEKKEAGDADANAAARFHIEVGTNTQKVLFVSETGHDAAEQEYYVEVVDETHIPEPDPDIATQFLYRYTLQIIDNPNHPGSLAEDVTNKEIKLSVEFLLGAEQVDLEENVIIKQDMYVAMEAPTFEQIALVGLYEALQVNYVAKETITTSDKSDPEKTATKLNLFVVDTGVVTQDTVLPAKEFSGSADVNDTDAECQYIAANINGGECVSCPTGRQIYLDTAAIDAIPGFNVHPATAAKSPYTVRGLENREEKDGVYVVFGQYEPAGIARSLCMPGLPKADGTMTELNGAGKAKVLDLRCFIATAAYGSALHGSVNLFRAFRDRVLLKFALGDWFVTQYYELSPAAAETIKDSPILKMATRVTLALPAAILDIFYDDDEIESYQPPH